LFTSKKTY